MPDHPKSVNSDAPAAAAADPQDDSLHYLLAGVYKKMGLQDKAQKELSVFEELRRKKHIHSKPQ